MGIVRITLRSAIPISGGDIRVEALNWETDVADAPISPSDIDLLTHWRTAGDANTFAEMVSRHSPMVYGTCVRILGNRSDSEDVTQECFLELLKHDVAIRVSLGGWLHTVATRRALNRLRTENRRQNRERKYAEETPMIPEPTWDEVRSYVDEAIFALPEVLREPIVLRFLEGKGHGAVARELGIADQRLVARSPTRDRDQCVLEAGGPHSNVS